MTDLTKLRTVEEHNEIVLEHNSNKCLTGVLCPACKDKELQFSSPGIKLLSSPAQMHVVCFNCNYTDTIFVK